MTSENKTSLEAPLIKFELKWEEKIISHDGFGEEEESWYESKKVTIYARSEDEACDIWEKEYANEGNNGIDSCTPCFEHPLLDRYIETKMPDGATYKTPVLFIAQHRAAYYAGQLDNDEIRSLAEDTVPYFETHHSEIAVWAAQNIAWQDIRKASIKTSPEPDPAAMQAAWAASGEDSKLLTPEFNAQSLKSLSAPSIVKIICGELQGDDLWKASAQELIGAIIPLMVKLRSVGWETITPDSIYKNISLYDLTHAISGDPETYKIHPTEYSQLIAPISLFIEKYYGMTPESAAEWHQNPKINERHEMLVAEIKSACLQALEKTNS
jgi:hypothetical protein